MGRIFKAPLLLIALSLLLGATLASAPAGAAGLVAIDDAPDCTELLPDGTSFNGSTANVNLDVLVLLDGISQDRAAQVMAGAARSYQPMHITLRSTFRTINVAPTGTYPNNSGKSVPSISSQGLIDASKAAVGGSRPAGIDVVYTITAKELTDSEGMADCIGGVRYPANAFAVGEEYSDDGEGQTGFLSGYKDASVKIAAHEIGHLMGAHHHYFNCAEASGTDDATVCTLMMPYIDYQTTKFGTLERNVIRGHAEDFAAP